MIIIRLKQKNAKTMKRRVDAQNRHRESRQLKRDTNFVCRRWSRSCALSRKVPVRLRRGRPLQRYGIIRGVCSAVPDEVRSVRSGQTEVVPRSEFKLSSSEFDFPGMRAFFIPLLGSKTGRQKDDRNKKPVQTF